MKSIRRSVFGFAGLDTLAVLVLLTGCGGAGSSAPAAPPATATISGTVVGTDNCNQPLAGVTVSINTSPATTATTDSSGNYSFTNLTLPAGAYTVTPSMPSATHSAFYPASQPVTVSGTNSYTENFGGVVAYDVSGTVNYSGSQTGNIYISLSGGCTEWQPGTTISAPGPFTIHGVQPGSYAWSAYMDTLHTGYRFGTDPTTYSSPTPITVGSANSAGNAMTLNDQSGGTTPSAPTLQSISPFNSGVFLAYAPGTATSYTVQWSTSSAFTTIAGSKTIPQSDNYVDGNWMVAFITDPSLADGTTYYFRAAANYNSNTSAYAVYASPYTGPIPILIGAPTAGNTVSGTVSFSGTETGTLYIGYLFPYSGTSPVFYGHAYTSPASTQAYTINVPNGTYPLIAFLDQNNDGVFNTGDVSNLNNALLNSSGGSISMNLSPTVIVSGALTNQNLTLADSHVNDALISRETQIVNSGTTTTGYGLDLQIGSNTKQVDSIQLTSAAHMFTPIDIAVNDGGLANSLVMNLGIAAPAANDAYTVAVTYSDGTSENIPLTVSTQAVTAQSSCATNLSPQTGQSTSTEPTFSWTPPANSSNYGYQFVLETVSYATTFNSYAAQEAIYGTYYGGITPTNDPLIPPGGFTNAVTSILWGVLPSGALALNGYYSVSPLFPPPNAYYWSVTSFDSNSDYCSVQVEYQP